MFEIMFLFVVFFLAMFMGAGMYFGGIIAEWTVERLHDYIKKLQS